MAEVTPDGELERYVDEGGGQALGDGEVISMAGWDRFISVFSGGEPRLGINSRRRARVSFW